MPYGGLNRMKSSLGRTPPFRRAFHSGSCTPRHSACAVPNGTARLFCLRDGVNCPMSTRARVQVAMSTSTRLVIRLDQTVHGVSQKPPSEHGFCNTAVRGVGSGWHFAPPPSCTAVMIMFSSRELRVMCRCMPPATWSAKMLRALSAVAVGTEFCVSAGRLETVGLM